MSYLAVVAADVIDYLRSFAIELVPDVWFECDGVPIKSNLPLGVIFDMFQPKDARGAWKITVRFRDFPEEKILHCCTRDTAEKLYMHSMKQALQTLHGSTRAFNAINTEDQSMLWETCNSGNLNGFESIANALRPTTRELTRCVPVRFLFVSSHNSEVLTIQKPIRMFLDETRNQVSTLESVLQQVAPSISVNDHEVVVQGVAVPFDSPIYELWLSFAHADLFLYVIIRPVAST
jgi:autophagy-related protein 5